MSNDPNDGFYVPPPRTKRDKIERLRTRLKQLRALDVTQGTRSVLNGILDYLADEANE